MRIANPSYPSNTLFSIMPIPSTRRRTGGYTVARRAAYTSGETLGSLVGGALGRLCAQELVVTAAQFEALIRRPGHRLREVLALSCACRVRRQSSRTLADFDVAGRQGQPPAWYWPAIREAFGLYCVLRQCAAPARRHPTLMQPAAHITDGVLRALRARGVRRTRNLTHAEMHAMAAAAAAKRIKTITGSPIVVWLDNIFRLDASYNPMTRGQHFQAAVVTFLVTPRLPPCPPLPTVPQLWANRRLAARMLDHWHPHLVSLLDGALRHPRNVTDIRVPLDRRREAVESLQWTPLSVNEHLVQAGPTLVEGLAFVRYLGQLSGQPPTPLLVDVDVWYRIMIMVYGVRHQHWDVRTWLRDVPPLFGVWHAYKHVVTVVYRTFHTHLTFLRFGTLPAHRKLPGGWPLRTLELTIAAVLLLPETERTRLRNRVTELQHLIQAKMAEIGAIVTAVGPSLRAPVVARMRAQYEALMDTLEEAAAAAAPTRLGHVALVRGSRLNDQERLRVALGELADLHRTKHVAEEFVALIDEWAPLCLVLGVMVRDCNWGNRTTGSGERAREVVLTALLALLYLTEGAEHRAQYVRQMCIVLVTWSRWHDYASGFLYTEEANEASLSPLGALCRSHRRLRTLADVMDLFLMVPLPPAGPHDRPSHPPTPQLQQTVRDNLSLLVRDGLPAVTYAPWLAECGSESQERWPDDWWTPRSLRDRPSRDHLVDLMTYAVHTLFRVPQPLTEKMKTALDTHATHRDTVLVGAAAAEVQAKINRGLPERYRRGAGRVPGAAPVAPAATPPQTASPAPKRAPRRTQSTAATATQPAHARGPGVRPAAPPH